MQVRFIDGVVAAAFVLACVAVGAAAPEASSALAESRQPGPWQGLGLYLAGGAALVAAAAAGIITWWRAHRAEAVRRAADARAASDRQAMQAQLLSQVADAIVAFDTDGVVTTWNAGAEAIFGHTATFALGKPVTDVIAHRQAANRESDLRQTITGRGEWKGDAEIIRPNGDTIFIEATLRVVTDAHGVAHGHLLVGHDVDARRRGELEARMRARQQSAIASLGQRALAGIDFELLCEQAVNVVSSTLQVYATGLFEAGESGAPLRRATTHGWPAALEPVRHVAADRSSYPGSALLSEAAVVVDDASALPTAFEGLVAAAAVAVPGCPGPYGVLLAGDRRTRVFSRDELHFLQSIANVIGSSYNRMMVERELRASVALRDATLEATAEGILATDADGRVIAFNQRLVDMWHFPPEVTASERFDDWVAYAAKQFVDPASCASSYRAASGADTVHVAVMPLTDGRVFERHSQPQRLDGRVVGRVWCYRDLTERVQAEDERRRLESQMQHMQKLESLGVMAGGIAHDFNNLLVGMLGHAGLALNEVPATSPVRDRIMQLQTAAQRAAELTNQMLTYSGKGRRLEQPADISTIVEEMVNLLRAAVSKNADLRLDIARNLPCFEGDTAQIRQVIMNLITNASDALGPHAGRIDVRTGLMAVTHDYLADACVGSDQPEGPYVFAEVRDSGCGMDPATIARIFDPFFTTKFTGRGLGLAAALGIVRGHGGAIKISSAPGRGTTFRVLLPASLTAARVVPAPQVTAPVPVDAHVLVVDDDSSVRMIARESLTLAGFTVTTAHDGPSAVEIVRGTAFDAVLLDLTMPGMSGVDTFHALKHLRPEMPIVLTSGYSEQQTEARFGSGDMDGFIQKPFLPAALVDAMRSALVPATVEVGR